jgi:hypothetical protein
MRLNRGVVKTKIFNYTIAFYLRFPFISTKQGTSANANNSFLVI